MRRGHPAAGVIIASVLLLGVGCAPANETTSDIRTEQTKQAEQHPVQNPEQKSDSGQSAGAASSSSQSGSPQTFAQFFAKLPPVKKNCIAKSLGSATVQVLLTNAGASPAAAQQTQIEACL